MNFNYNKIIKKTNSLKNIILNKEKKNIHSAYLDLKNEFVSLKSNNIENNLLEQLNKIYLLINGRGIRSDNINNLIIEEINILLNMINKYSLDYENKVQSDKLNELKQKKGKLLNLIDKFKNKKNNMLMIFLISIVVAFGISVFLPTIICALLGEMKIVNTIYGFKVLTPILITMSISKPVIAAIIIYNIIHLVNNHKVNKDINKLKEELKKLNISIDEIKKQIENNNQKYENSKIVHRHQNTRHLPRLKNKDDDVKAISESKDNDIKFLEERKKELIAFKSNNSLNVVDSQKNNEKIMKKVNK